MAGLLDLDKMRKTIRGLAERYRAAQTDAYINMATGVGTERDKSTAGTWAYGGDMLDLELELLYANNDLAAVIVEKIVEDSLRAGFSIQREGSTPEADAELTKRILSRFVDLQVGEGRFMRGAVWGRLFGGGGLILGVRGAGGWESELDETLVTKVEWVKDFDKQQMQPYTYGNDGQVRTYLYTPLVSGVESGEAAVPVEIHRSRLILFPGARTTNRKKQERQGWDLSVLQRVRGALLSFDGMWGNVDAMFQDASQAVFHMQGLIQSLGEDTGKEDVSVRLRIMDTFRSAARAIIMDAGDENGDGKEDFKVVDRASLGGLDKVMQNYMIRLATAARMPLTVLLGMSPAGMDATGESDMILYFNTVDIYRQQVLQERLLRLVRLIHREIEAGERGELDAFESEAPTTESDTDGEWSIVWPELARPKPLDVATAENMRITSALAMVQSQAWTPEEVALNMNVIAPTMGARIDLAPRRKALKAAHEEVANREVGMGALESQSEIETESTIKVEKAKPKPTAGAPAAKQSERKTPSKAAKRQV